MIETTKTDYKPVLRTMFYRRVRIRLSYLSGFEKKRMADIVGIAGMLV